MSCLFSFPSWVHLVPLPPASHSMGWHRVIAFFLCWHGCAVRLHLMVRLGFLLNSFWLANTSYSSQTAGSISQLWSASLPQRLFLVLYLSDKCGTKAQGVHTCQVSSMHIGVHFFSGYGRVQACILLVADALARQLTPSCRSACGWSFMICARDGLPLQAQAC